MVVLAEVHETTNSGAGEGVPGAATLSPLAILKARRSPETLRVAPIGTLTDTCRGGPNLVEGAVYLLFLVRTSDGPEANRFTMHSAGEGTYRLAGSRVIYLALESQEDPSKAAASQLSGLLALLQAEFDLDPSLIERAAAVTGPLALPSTGSGGLARSDGGLQAGVLIALSVLGLAGILTPLYARLRIRRR